MGIKFLSTIFIFGCLLQGIQGYAKGAPNSDQVCETMMPKHGTEPMTSVSPYGISSDRSDINGGSTDGITFTLEASSVPEDYFKYFKGFMAMVKKDGEPKKNYGTFKIPQGMEELIKTSSCFNVQESMITHTTNNNKSIIQFQWIPPNEDIEGLQLFVTFVRDWNEIWRAVPHSQKLSVKKSNPTMRSDAPGDASLQSKLESTYAECTVGSCMGIPSGCIQSFHETKNEVKPCSAFLSWRVKDDVTEYTLAGQLQGGMGYAAMGFSDNPEMGNDSVAGCYMDDGKPSIHRFVNPGYSNEISKDPMQGINPKSTEIIDNHIFCTFDQFNHNITDVLNVHLTSDSYYIMLAHGTTSSSNGLGYHDLKTTSVAKHSIHDKKIIVTDEDEEVTTK